MTATPTPLRELLTQARREFRDSDAAGDVLDWLEERAALSARDEAGAVGDDRYPHLYNVAQALAIAGTLAPGFRLIYRDAFRWKDARDGAVLSNHYDGQDAPYLAETFNYDLVADLGFAAILRDTTATPPASGEAVLTHPARVAGRDFMPGEPVQRVLGRAHAHYDVTHASGEAGAVLQDAGLQRQLEESAARWDALPDWVRQHATPPAASGDTEEMAQHLEGIAHLIRRNPNGYPRLLADAGTLDQAAALIRRLAALEAQASAPSGEVADAAFEAGWITAAKWAKRDDLLADIDSPAYERDRADALAARTGKDE